ATSEAENFTSDEIFFWRALPFLSLPLRGHGVQEGQARSPAFRLHCLGRLTSLWRETSPEGATQKSPGRKPGANPGNKQSNNGSPEGAMQWWRYQSGCLMT